MNFRVEQLINTTAYTVKLGTHSSLPGYGSGLFRYLLVLRILSVEYAIYSGRGVSRSIDPHTEIR